MFNRAERTSDSVRGTPAVAVSGYRQRGSVESDFCRTPATNKGGGGGEGYLDYNANVSFEAENALHNLGTFGITRTCDWAGFQWFIPGECQNGHRFAKTLVCGKEWCGVCGEDNSVAHLRRFARWLSKVQQFGMMGYFVFTLPPELRSRYRTKQALGELGHKVQELLKGFGYSRGLRRWHYFGDYAGLIGGREVNLDELRVRYVKAFNRLVKTFAKMNGSDLVLNPNKATIFWSNPGGQHSSVIARLVADFTKTYGLHLKPYSSIKPNPHLNSLVDGGFIPEAKLQSIKKAYASLLGVDLADVNYHYRLSPGKMVHTLKYVTRATFRDYDWDLELALELRGFRNMVVWGRPDKVDKNTGEIVVREWRLPGVDVAWSLGDLGGEAREAIEDMDIEAIEALAEKRCPVCGETVVWGEALPIGLLAMVDKMSLGAGYYRLADNRSPPERDEYHPKYPLLGYLTNLKHFNLVKAQEWADARIKAEAEDYQSSWADLLN